jgi:phosphopantetheinyl transferase
VFPAEVAVTNDEVGRPIVTMPSGDLVTVSIAHTGPLAVAMVRSGRARVGIDIEAVTPRTDGLEETATTLAERQLLDQLAAPVGPEDRLSAFTRFWAAKEAVAKAEGTGLGGAPRRFVVWRVDGDRLLVTATASGRGYWVTTSLIEHGAGTYAVAWTED